MKKNIFKIVLLLIVISFTFVLSSCGKAKKPGTVSNLKYDGATITWIAADKATQYEVNVNGHEYKIPGTSITYNAIESDSQVVVSITAIGSKEKHRGDTVTETFTKLAPVTDIHFNEDGEMSWTGVNGVGAYEIKINNQVFTTSNTYFNEFLYGQRNNIQIRPIPANDKSFSYFSKMISKTYLTTPNEIKYDGEYLSWRGSNESLGYEIYINGGKVETTNKTSYKFDAEEKSFNVSIKSLGEGVVDGNVFSSKPSEEIRFVYLSAPTNIEVVDGIVKWEEIEDATGYKVKVDGTDYNVTTNEFTKLSSGIDHTVSIKPLVEEGTVYFSSWSAPKNIHILNAPVPMWNDSISLDDGEAKRNLYWNYVTSGEVAAYNVIITKEDGIVEVTATTGNDFAYGFVEAGTYKIELQSIAAENSTCYDSKKSTPIYVVRLLAPTAKNENFITSNPTSVEDGFTVNYNSVSGASGYQLYKDGLKVSSGFTSNTSMTVFNVADTLNDSAQTYNYAIQAIGQRKTISGETYYYLNSLIDEGFKKSLSFQISVLAVPRNVQISGYEVTWESDSAANGFAVNFGTTSLTNTNNYSLLGLPSAGVYDLSVCAKGNGSNVLPSKYTASKHIVKLEAPKNIRIGTTNDEGKLLWDDVQYANSYKVKFGSTLDAEAIDASTVDNVNRFFQTTANTISMIAEANYELAGVYYVSSNYSEAKQVIKLAQVTFNQPAFKGNMLVWNHSSNINSAIYTPTYKIYNENNVAYNGNYNGTQFDISTLPGGESYTFIIKAIGDGTNYINSELSDRISIWKLETPTVERGDGCYKWYGVPSANYYTVHVDGELVYTVKHDGVKEYTYNIDLSKFSATNKTYKVEVKAVGDGGFETIDSNPYVIEQKVLKLDTPSITTGYSDLAYNENGSIILTVKNDVPFNSGYVYTIGGAQSQVINELTYSYKTHSVGEFKVSCKAVGGKFDDNEVLRIDSDDVTSSIVLLDYTNIEVSMDGMARWNPVNKCTGYKIVITYDDNTTAEKTTKGTYLNLNSSEFPFKYDRIVSVSITVLGNGTTTISSETTVWVKD